MNIIKIVYGNGNVIVPTLTWVSDISSVIQNQFKPIFVDINPKTLSMDEDQIINKVNEKTKAVFLTHAQGFNGLSKKLLNFLKEKKIPLIEDVCESHGAVYKKKKLGTYGLISNFSFYYAHHMSTIEGGMICTNNKKIYELSLMLRSHGMLRECGNDNYEKKLINKYSNLSPKFIFLYPAYNMRNNELSAVIGLSQIKRLNKNNKIRTRNFKLFLENIDNSIFRTEFEIDGSCNYAFPLVLRNKNFEQRDKLEKIMKENNIEFRRGNAGGGNQLRQPYLKNYVKNLNLKKYKEVDHIHFFGYYIGNYPSLTVTKIKTLCKILNSKMTNN